MTIVIALGRRSMRAYRRRNFVDAWETAVMECYQLASRIDPTGETSLQQVHVILSVLVLVREK